MQITIAVAVPYHQYREWRREENKNTDDTVQKSIDGKKQIKRKQEACANENADDTKQNCGMKTYGICGSPRVPI
ncbi:hypothetical protein T4C_9161, partial [Trichinella pseudospiralis]